MSFKRLLITGFDPFGGESVNPSYEAVKGLPDIIGEYSLTKACIPTKFGAANEKVIELAEKIQPHAIICVGQAGGRGRITPEVIGINGWCNDSAIITYDESFEIPEEFAEKSICIVAQTTINREIFGQIVHFLKKRALHIKFTS